MMGNAANEGMMLRILVMDFLVFFNRPSNNLPLINPYLFLHRDASACFVVF